MLSGSGGLGKTRLNARAISGKPRSAKKRRSRCPLELMLGSLGETGPANSQENVWEREALKLAGKARKIKARLENIMTQLLAKRHAQILAGKARRPGTDWQGKVRLLEKNKLSGDTFVLAEPKRQP